MKGGHGLCSQILQFLFARRRRLAIILVVLFIMLLPSLLRLYQENDLEKRKPVTNYDLIISRSISNEGNSPNVSISELTEISDTPSIQTEIEVPTEIITESTPDFDTDAFLVHTPGCRIPAMKPVNPDVEEFVYDYDTVKCDDIPPLVESNDTALLLIKSAIPYYNTTEKELTCCYRAMWRFSPMFTLQDWSPTKEQELSNSPLYDGVKYGNDIRYSNTCIAFSDTILVQDEFVRVECSARSKELYRDYHGFAPVKKPRGTQTEDVEGLNVLLVGIDSVSRLNFLRKMPLTVDYLTTVLNGVDLLGYNKIEDNTFPNIIPMLTGFSIPELSQTCWPKESAHFDPCPWIWKDFNRHGYVNLFAEDTAWMGLFHYLKKGFVQQPTDYDPRPLMYIIEKELGVTKKGLNAPFCVGKRLQISVLIDYSSKFIRAMHQRNQKMFGLIWGTSLSHDYLNNPDEADQPYFEFLQGIHETGVLNNTALIFMSDHGLRYGKILSTYQGHLEERLPILYVVLPEWFKAKYPRAFNNLKTNRRRLVTVYDLHETFKDFMDHKQLINMPVEESEKYPRGISLFHSIPPTRTCTEAGIPNHYCACQYMSQIPTNDSTIQEVASFMVNSINERLKNYTQCEQLKLKTILDAWRGEATAHVNETKTKFKEHQYQIKIYTEPGDALLSGTIRHDPEAKKMQVAGSISRLNAYGKQSWCMPEYKLRLYCYCSSPLPLETTFSYSSS